METFVSLQHIEKIVKIGVEFLIFYLKKSFFALRFLVLFSTHHYLFPSYYHGTISREEAVKRLQEFNKDGAFLLRMSATQKDAYTISLQYVCIVSVVVLFIYVCRIISL